MSDAATPEDDARPSVSEAFDWRAGRTWAAFVGSALACGSLIAAGVLGVQVLYLGLPSAPVTKSDSLIGVLIVILVVALPLILLRYLLVRGRLYGGEGARTEEALGDPRQFKTWNDFWLQVFWCGVLALPQMTVHFGFFSAPPEASMIVVWAYVVAIGYSGFLLPAVMHRWA